MRDRPRFRRDQIAQRIRRVIAADSILVGVNFQNILGSVRIMLQRRQRFDQPSAPFVNEKPCRNARLRLTDRVFLDKPKSNRIIDPPKKRWPDYLTKVRRLRNEAAHLRNISFQDIEDLLEILNAVRRDQLDFLIVP